MNEINSFMKESTEFGLKKKKQIKIPKNTIKILGIILGVIVVVVFGLILFKAIKKSKKNLAKDYIYKLEKITDTIDDEVVSYEECMQTDSGYYFEYKTSDGTIKNLFYDLEGKDVTKKIMKSKVENIEVSSDDKLVEIVDENKRTIISTKTFKKVSEISDSTDWYGVIDNKYLLYKNEFYYGLSKLNGDIVIPFEYSYIKYDKHVLFALKDDKLSIFNYEGKGYTAKKYDSDFSSVFYDAYELFDNLFVFKADDKIGLINSKGKEIGFDSKYDKFSYDKKLKVIYAIGEDYVDLYNEKLELKKQIKLEDGLMLYSGKYNKDDETIYYNYFNDKDDNTYILNEKLELNNLGNVRHKANDETEEFDIYDDFIIKEVSDNTYAFYDYNNKNINKDEFKYIEKKQGIYSNSEDTYDYFIACLYVENDEKIQCGIVNDKGKLVTDLNYNYELYNDKFKAVGMYNNEVFEYNAMPEFDSEILNKYNLIIHDQDNNNILNSEGEYVVVGYNAYYSLFDNTAYLVEIKYEEQSVYELYDDRFNLIDVENIGSAKDYISGEFINTDDGIYQIKRY